jgi:glyoxylase-like metal-dependent hydrolase (beta-lactamase superfamily II)
MPISSMANLQHADHTGSNDKFKTLFGQVQTRETAKQPYRETSEALPTEPEINRILSWYVHSSGEDVGVEALSVLYTEPSLW